MKEQRMKSRMAIETATGKVLSGRRVWKSQVSDERDYRRVNLILIPKGLVHDKKQNAGLT